MAVDGTYDEGTVNHLVDNYLQVLADRMKRFAGEGKD